MENTETKTTTKPTYIARVITSLPGLPEAEAEVKLEPYFSRDGRLMGFVEVSRTHDWIRPLEPSAQLTKTYAKAVEALNGREPTEADADEDGVVRIAATVRQKTVRDHRHGMKDTYTQHILIEATF